MAAAPGYILTRERSQAAMEQTVQKVLMYLMERETLTLLEVQEVLVVQADKAADMAQMAYPWVH